MYQILSDVEIFVLIKFYRNIIGIYCNIIVFCDVKSYKYNIQLVCTTLIYIKVRYYLYYKYVFEFRYLLLRNRGAGFKLFKWFCTL